MLIEFEELVTGAANPVYINPEHVVLVRASPDANVTLITTIDREKYTVKGKVSEIADKLNGK